MASHEVPVLNPGEGLCVAVTGAAGFIGRVVIDRIQAGALGPVSDLRLNDVKAFDHPSASVVGGSFADAEVRRRLVGGGVDVLFHLASLPGGAAERDPALGRRVNLDGSIALTDAVAEAAAGASATRSAPVVVYASSIAALGAGARPVDAATALRPVGGYGTHKAMVEFYLSDLSRRGLIDGRAVRPAGIVARPRDAYDGFATAWMSDLFHAAYEGRDVVIPIRARAHAWLQSVDAVADNLIHAALMPTSGLGSYRAWTLPATVVRMEALIAALGRRTGHSVSVEYGAGLTDHPALDSSAELALGFVSDGDADALVDVVMRRIERP